MNLFDSIAEAALKHYSTLSGNGKPNDKEWTVYSAIVAVKQQQPQTKVFVVSSGTGSKCLGYDQVSKSCDCLLRDSHAEVLARRGFVFATISQMDALSRNLSLSESTSFVSSSKLLNTDTVSKIANFSITPAVSFYLYISDSPCGDSTIYDLDDNHVKFTGAKLPTSTSDSSLSISFVREPNHQATSLMRLKPGRSNIKPESRTRSMSCSDKIVRWNKVSERSERAFWKTRAFRFVLFWTPLNNLLRKKMRLAELATMSNSECL